MCHGVELFKGFSEELTVVRLSMIHYGSVIIGVIILPKTLTV